MKIISKYSDYYDTALSLGIDESVVYIRKNKKVGFLTDEAYSRDSLFALDDVRRRSPNILNAIPSNIIKFYEDIQDFHINSSLNVSNGRLSCRFSLRSRYILFAGELVQMIFLEGSVGNGHNQTEVSECVYSYEQLIKCLSKYIDKRDINTYMKGNKRWSKASRESAFTNFFSIRKQGYEFFHHTLDAPIIELKKMSYIRNPCLKELNFARYYDAFTAFQNLSMFISGVLGGQSPKLVEIEDKYRIVSHGFDIKTSFRNRKEG